VVVVIFVDPPWISRLDMIERSAVRCPGVSSKFEPAFALGHGEIGRPSDVIAHAFVREEQAAACRTIPD